MRRFGVIGYPIKQSFSPDYFANKYKKLGLSDYSYVSFEMQSAEGLKSFLAKNELDGINITMPLKQSVIHQLDGISYTAGALNAVNTIHVKNSKLYGYNTDVFGFRDSLLPLLNSQHTSALVFGTGGSSLAVTYVLRQLGIDYKLVSTSGRGDYTYEQLTQDIIQSNKILINTTPLGMQHRLEEMVPIPYNAIGDLHLCYDLIYTPAETAFLKTCKVQGASIKNGLQMLELQADKSWEIWNV